MVAISSADVILFEKFRFDRRGGSLVDLEGGSQLAIGSRALDILGILLDRAGDLVSKDEIMASVWPGTVIGDGSLTVQISALRRILDRGRVEGSCIRTVAGRGYRFVAAVTRHEAAPVGSGALAPHVPHRAAPRLSIVVLPIANLSSDPEQEYFVDAMTEDLTTDLSRITGSFVISCNTAFTYKSRRVGAKQIGAELAVRYVLEGSVQRSGPQVRINAQLIDAETDSHVWAERFERTTNDLFALRDEITSRIAVSLDLELVGAEAARPNERPDALDYILRGRAVMMAPPSRAKYATAIDLFERALALDPRSVAAQCYLAYAITGRILDNMTATTADEIERAEDLVAQALAASPRLPLAHLVKASVLRTQQRFEEAISEYETVIAIDRNSANAYDRLGQCKLFTGSIEEVIPLAEHAIRLSPRAPTIGLCYLRIGQVHLVQSRTGEAIVWFEKARNAIPAHPAVHAYLAAAYALGGAAERAAAELAEARRLGSDDRYSSSARFKAANGFYALPRVRALFEATYIRGLRLAGMPE